MTDFNPKTSWGKIVRYNKYNTEEYETVGPLIQGQQALVDKLKELLQNESHPHKWGYYWKWVKHDQGDQGTSKVSASNEW